MISLFDIAGNTFVINYQIDLKTKTNFYEEDLFIIVFNCSIFL